MDFRDFRIFSGQCFLTINHFSRGAFRAPRLFSRFPQNSDSHVISPPRRASRAARFRTLILAAGSVHHE